MPYEIWRSLVAQQKLANLEIVEPEIARQIDKMLNSLAIDREGFITGEPQKMESFVVGQFVIIYRALHRLKIVEITDIREKS